MKPGQSNRICILLSTEDTEGRGINLMQLP